MCCLLQVLCYEDARLMKLFKDIVKLLYNAGETQQQRRSSNNLQHGDGCRYVFRLACEGAGRVISSSGSINLQRGGCVPNFS